MAAAQDPSLQNVTIGFSEFPPGTVIDHQYLDEGVTFGEPGLSTAFTSPDAADPTAPVLSGTPRFFGDVNVAFVNPDFGDLRVVPGFSVNIGYIDSPGTTTLSLIALDGEVLESYVIEQTGIVTANVNALGNPLAGFRVTTVDDDHGFAIDNLTFPGYPQVPADQAGASNPSEPDTTCYTAMPVNCATGEFDHTFNDVAIPGRGPGLNLQRTYSSAAASADGPFGHGWNYSYGMSATTLPSGEVDIDQENGSQVAFSPDSSGGYTAPGRVLASLAGTDDGGLVFTRRPDGTAYHFDATGRLTAITARTGETSTLSYTDDGTLAAVTDEAGRRLTFSWSGGHITGVTDPLGRSLTYSYDDAGDLISAKDRAGATWSFGYDAQHRLTSMTDPNGHPLTNVYDDQGRVTSQTDGAALTSTFAYAGDPASANGTTTVTGPHGELTTYTYVHMQLMSIGKSEGYSTAVTSYTYDPRTLGRASVTDPNGRTTYTAYDADGNVLSTMDGFGYTTTYTYDAADDKISQTTPKGETTTWTYSSPGVLQQITDPTGATTSYQHGDSAHPADVTGTVDADGRITGITRDAYGDAVGQTTHPAPGQSMSTQGVYDADGELLCLASGDAVAAGHQCDSQGARVAGTTSYTYDGDGRTTSTTDPAGHTSSTSYDGDGNPITTTDALGTRTTRSYDGDSRVLTSTLAAGKAAAATTTYKYDLPAGTDPCTDDVNSNIALTCSTITSPTGAVTVNWYGPRHELLAEQAPVSGRTTYYYNQSLDQYQLYDAIHGQVRYTYDADDRLGSMGRLQTPNRYFTYDADGHRLAVQEQFTGKTTSYTYDADGRLTSTTDENGQTVSYRYDPAGDQISITYPDGRQVSRSYDGARRLISITDPAGRSTGFRYDADGNVVSTSYPGGTVSQIAYSPDDTVLGDNITGTAGDLASTTLSRDADQRITAETDTGALGTTTTGSYSARGELTSWAGQAFSYTRAGELTKAGTARFTVNSAGALTRATGLTPDPNIYYVNGIGSRTGASEGTLGSFKYDSQGILIQAGLNPLVTSAGPTTGPAGTTVTLTGEHLNDVYNVEVANHWNIAFAHVDDQHLQVTMPAGTGTEPIVVGDSFGTSDQVSFSYSGIGVAALSPPAGRVSGGNTVTITGSGFTGATAVNFGATPAASFAVVNDSKLTAVPPPASPGTVGVTVTSPQGSSVATPGAHYGYSSGPTVTSIPPIGAPGVGETLEIDGSGFSNATAVTFGSQPAQSFTIESASKINAVIPNGTGTVDITVTSPKGTSPLIHADQFTYPPGSVPPAPRSTSEFDYTYDVQRPAPHRRHPHRRQVRRLGHLQRDTATHRRRRTGRDQRPGRPADRTNRRRRHCQLVRLRPQRQHQTAAGFLRRGRRQLRLHRLRHRHPNLRHRQHTIPIRRRPYRPGHRPGADDPPRIRPGHRPLHHRRPSRQPHAQPVRLRRRRPTQQDRPNGPVLR